MWPEQTPLSPKLRMLHFNIVPAPHTRPTSHACLFSTLSDSPPTLQGGGSATPATDVICPMYARIPQLAALAAAAGARGDPRPVLLCEYAHSMGNSTGNLAEYWELFRSDARVAGGFIWDWADQSLLKRERRPDGTEVSVATALGCYPSRKRLFGVLCAGWVWVEQVQGSHTCLPSACRAERLHCSDQVCLKLPFRFDGWLAAHDLSADLQPLPPLAYLVLSLLPPGVILGSRG